MSIILNPEIDKLDKNSLCYNIYIQLYNNFFNAQDKKSEDNPFGIEEGDQTSIRLKNTAFNFASPISESIVGSESGEGGGSGGVLLNYVKRGGDNMSGFFRANYGFEAGINNTRVIHISQRDILDENNQVISTENEFTVSGNVYIGGNSFYLGGKNVLAYDQQSKTTRISSTIVDFGKSKIKGTGEIIVGLDKSSGVYITPEVLQIKGNNVYHSGNANLKDIDWNMLNSNVFGVLNVKGETVLKGKLTSSYGVDLGTGGKTILSIIQNAVNINGFIAFGTGYGIKIDDLPVLIRSNANDIQISSTGGDLLLGNDNTQKIRLLSNVADANGTNVLLTKYGEAFFPGSIRIKHDYGDDLMSSYRVDNNDEGLTIHKKLRFGSSIGAYLIGENRNIGFVSSIDRIDPSTLETTTNTYKTTIQYKPSTSVYQVQNRYSDTLAFVTESDFVSFNKPVEANNFIGIEGSSTRLLNNSLFFTNKSYLHSIVDGIKHYGNAYFTEDLSSENFSSGFAGSGWAIRQNKTTGNITITCDEAVFRKKVRIYELEVQKETATNGSLWITDSCSGDIVEKL
jgi:hypothetical protein